MMMSECGGKLWVNVEESCGWMWRKAVGECGGKLWANVEESCEWMWRKAVGECGGKLWANVEESCERMWRKAVSECGGKLWANVEENCEWMWRKAVSECGGKLWVNVEESCEWMWRKAVSECGRKLWVNVEENCGQIWGLSRYLPGEAERNSKNLSGYSLIGFETGAIQIQSRSVNHLIAAFVGVNCRYFKLRVWDVSDVGFSEVFRSYVAGCWREIRSLLSTTTPSRTWLQFEHCKYKTHVRAEVLTWPFCIYVTPCSLVGIYRRFRRIKRTYPFSTWPLSLGFVSPCIIIHSNKSNQPDASISHIYSSSLKYNSTCFGHPHAHRQELINCSSRLRFTVGTWW